MLSVRDREYVQRLVRESKDRAPKGVTLWSATTTAAADIGVPVSLILDGDSVEITALNTTGAGIAAGQRVMVTLVPPHGIYVTGFAGTSGQGSSASVVLDADTASVSLSVPAGANEVEIRASLRSNRATAQDSIAVRLNEDATSSYLTAYLYNTGTTPKAFTQADVGRFYAGECAANTAAATLRSACRIELVDVANVTAHKEGIADSSLGGSARFALGWRWPSISPITLVELRPWYGTSWKAGSSARLYAR